jgi:hypothetical protein
MENAAKREAVMKKKIQSAQTLGANVGDILGSIGGGLSMLAEDDEVEQNIKDDIE